MPARYTTPQCPCEDSAVAWRGAVPPSPCPSPSRSSSWPPARVRACFRTLRRFFIRLPVSPWSSGLPMRRARSVRDASLRCPARRWRGGGASGRGRGRRAARGRGHRGRGSGCARRVVRARPDPLGGPSTGHARSARRAARRARAAASDRDDPHHRPAQPPGLRTNRAGLQVTRRPHRRDQVRRGRLAGGARRGGDHLGTYVFEAETAVRRPRRGPARERRALPHGGVPVDPRRRRQDRDACDRRRGRRTRGERPGGPDGGRGAGPAPHPRGPREAGGDVLAAGDHPGRGGRDDRSRHHCRAGPGPGGRHGHRRALPVGPHTTVRDATIR